LAKVYLKLPSRIGSIGHLDSKSSFKDATWAVAYGLCIWGIHAEESPEIDNSSLVFKKVWKKIVQGIKQFLP
jgi:hypothetical protein